MNNRCIQPHHPAFKDYGGRGISVCEEWRKVPGYWKGGQEGFWCYVSYVEGLGEKPSPSHSLDRTDNDGNYEPGNLDWKDKPGQNRNRRPLSPHSQSKSKVGASGIRGVSRNGGKWMAKIRHKGEWIYLGTYETPEEAGAVWEAKRKELRGDA
ncbi:hypothetical protein N9997_01585 [Synechococcus sp. AH-603-L18]|nr:hypothetical protein [Synechococcus sp. AH-603-L18]